MVSKVILGIFLTFGVILLSSILSVDALEENGVIENPYTENIPTIDGKWTTPEEWTDAFLHTDTTKNGETFYLLTKHDRDFVYVMFNRAELMEVNLDDTKVTVDNDKTKHVDDYVKICFDTNNDGGYERKSDDFCFIAFAIDNDGYVSSDIVRKSGGEILRIPSGTSVKAKFSSENDPYESGRDHLIYEIKIPISFLHKNDAYGFKYDMWDQGESFKVHTWPHGSDDKSPETWGSIVDIENKVTAPPVPFLSISTKEIDFGNTAVSESSKRGVTISNKGTAVLLITSISASGNFAVRGIDTPAEIQPNTSVSFDVNFSPLSLGSKTGSVTIKTNDLSSKTLVIQTSGQGTEKGAIGGGCLIATATFGSELSPQVQQLREIRDNVILETESGTSFMTGFNDFYYSFSPTIADWERENPAFKELVKVTITPMLSTLSILNYIDVDSEAEMLGYGIGIIMLNVGMYFGLPVVAIIGLRKIK